MTLPARVDRLPRFRVLAREPVDEATDDIRRATRQLVGGVCVVTHGIGEARKGVTASSVSSLGSDPPTLVVCLRQGASIFSTLSPGDAFGVSVLSANQVECAERFVEPAGASDVDRFLEDRWRALSNGVLVLGDAAAVFACEVEEIVERHGHGVVFGRVQLAASGSESGALVHWCGTFDQIGWSDEEVARAIGLTPLDVAR